MTDKAQKLMGTRCSQGWHGKICAKPEVLELVEKTLKRKDEPSRENSAENVQENPTVEITQAALGRRYQAFLGAIYCEKGLDEVRKMLNAHDPGYACNHYVWKLRNLMTSIEERFAKIRPFFW